MQTIDVDDTRAAAAEPAASSSHAGHYVTPHDHTWQPPEHPRCSARFWCGKCRDWIVGPRCPVGQSNPRSKSHPFRRLYMR